MSKQVAKIFVSDEKAKFKWGLGKVVASSFSGFIAGIIVAALIFFNIFEVSMK